MSNNHQGILLEVRGFQRIVVQRGFDMTHDLERGQTLLAKLDAFLADVPFMMKVPEGRVLGVTQRIESLIDDKGAYKAAELLHAATTKCRTKWRKSKSDTKEYWLAFYRDRVTGGINVSCFGHNAIADCRNHPYFIGMKHVKINMEKLEK